MGSRARHPIALTVAGSDSGGGAGVQADLKTFAALGVHGTSAITCLTAQNPRGVTGIEAVKPAFVAEQIRAVFNELPPAAVKTGMLFSASVIRAVAEALGRERARRHGFSLVVDPVMVATSGARLLKPEALRSLVKNLLPLADVVTPNLDETEILIGWKPADPQEMRRAAREIRRRFGCAALVKGGHLKGMREAVDIFWDGREELLLTAPYVRHVSTHGTGCTYSAALAAALAQGFQMAGAVQRAKELVTRAVAGSVRVARHDALDPFSK